MSARDDLDLRGVRRSARMQQHRAHTRRVARPGRGRPLSSRLSEAIAARERTIVVYSPLRVLLHEKARFNVGGGSAHYRPHSGVEVAEHNAMIRKAFRMTVNAGAASEYEGRHNPIWPELEATLIQHGVLSYSIFLDPDTQDLFAYAEVESEERWTAIASTEVCQRWWGHMRDLMPTRSDNSPVSSDLREVFHIEAGESFRGTSIRS